MIPQPTTPQGATSQRILVVDNIADSRLLLKLYLRLAGYQVDEAATGRQALAFVQQGESPALIILDLLLPDMDGFVAAEAIHALNNTPIIFLSALSDLATKTHALTYYAEDYLTKPCDFAELRARIERVLAHTPKVQQRKPVAVATEGTHRNGTTEHRLFNWQAQSPNLRPTIAISLAPAQQCHRTTSLSLGALPHP